MSKPLSLFRVLLLVRDARSTKGADRHLLVALALRCNPQQNYKCFPSYRQLALDTGLHEITLKKSAASLEKRTLIKRVTRRNRSNVYFLNVPLLEKQAGEVNRLEKEAMARIIGEVENPFGLPNNAEEDLESDDFDNTSRWEGIL